MLLRVFWIMLLAGSCLGQDSQVYQVTDEDKLKVARLESQFWRLQFALEQAVKQLESEKARIRQACEHSGGEYVEEMTQEGGLDPVCKREEEWE